MFTNYIFRILLHDSKGLGYNEKVRHKCEEMYKEGCRTNHLLACIIDICQEKCSSDETPSSLFHINSAYEVSKFLCLCIYIKFILMRLMCLNSNLFGSAFFSHFSYTHCLSYFYPCPCSFYFLLNSMLPFEVLF